MLIHVVDYSNPHDAEQIELTNEILTEIGVECIPVIYAYNKTDLVQGKVKNNDDNHLYISAKTKQGMEALTEAISEQVVAYFNEHTHVVRVKHEAAGTRMKVECRQADVKRYEQYIIKENRFVADHINEKIIA